MAECQARGCTEPAWDPQPPFPPAESYPFALCVPHWNADGHHPIVVETRDADGARILHIWPNPPDDPWRLSN